METTTLGEMLADTTPEHLGPEADDFDLKAYSEALERAWPAEVDELDAEAAEALSTSVLEGRAGRDDAGRDWVQVAASRRA